MTESLHQSRSSRKLYIPIYTLMMIALGLTTVFITTNKISSNMLIPIGFVVIIVFKATEIHRLGHQYEINNRSVVHTQGYLSKHSRRIDLFAISDIIVKQTTFQRLFGFGDVVIRLFAIDTQNILKNINNPRNFAQQIEEAVAHARQSPNSSLKQEIKQPVQTPGPTTLTHDPNHLYPSSDHFEEI